MEDITYDRTEDKEGTSPLRKRRSSKHSPQMSVLAGWATITNLVLATGPFTYPYSFVNGGILLNVSFMIITMIAAYISVNFMIEAIWVSCALNSIRQKDYHIPLLDQDEIQEEHQNEEINVYYIREKIEIGQLAQDHIKDKAIRIVIIIILVVYMYGAMCLKYIAGSQSLMEGISVSVYGDNYALTEVMHPIDPYYVGVLFFGIVSLAFSFGNIERSKYLQITVTILRIFTVLLMIGASLFIINQNGTVPLSKIRMADFSYLDTIAGNTAFIFICHHSIPGIIYPIKQQNKIKSMFYYSFILSAIALLIEGLLASFAFNTESLVLVATSNNAGVEPIKKLYNLNFVDIPFVGQFTNFYPFLNVAAVPIITITLRNNILFLIGKADKELSDLAKGLCSIILTVPAIIISLLLDDPQEMLKYTGGITGSFILFILPAMFYMGSRLHILHDLLIARNFNASSFGTKWALCVMMFALAIIIIVFYGLLIDN